MLLRLKYGDAIVEADYPYSDCTKELRPNHVATLQQPPDLLASALNKPKGTYPFKHVFRSARNLVIVISNQRWPGTVKHFLPAIVNLLNLVNVPDEEIKIVVANGTHPALAAVEVRELVGATVAARIAVVQHDLYDHDSVTFVGETRGGIPLFINKHLYDADEMIIFGNVSHHFLSGYTGGPDLIVPGCTGIETMNRLCMLAINKEQATVKAAFQNGISANNNPIHNEVNEAIRGLSPRYGIYSIANDYDVPVALFAGHPRQSFAAARRAADRMSWCTIQEKADLTIVSAGGTPKDLDYMSAFPALHRARVATKPGGTIILVASCTQGLGDRDLPDWLHALQNGALHGEKSAHFAVNSLTAVLTREIASQYRVFFVTSLPCRVAAQLGFLPMESLQAAVDAARAKLPKKYRTYILPDGSMIVPRLNGAPA